MHRRATEPTQATSKIAPKKKVFMAAISQRSADWLYWSGNTLLVLVAILGVIGALAMFWGERVRDHFADQRVAEADQRTADAELELARVVALIR